MTGQSMAWRSGIGSPVLAGWALTLAIAPGWWECAMDQGTFRASQHQQRSSDRSRVAEDAIELSDADSTPAGRWPLGSSALIVHVDPSGPAYDTAMQTRRLAASATSPSRVECDGPSLELT